MVGKIVDCKRPFRTIVFDLLMVAEEEGWICHSRHRDC